MPALFEGGFSIMTFQPINPSELHDYAVRYFVVSFSRSVILFIYDKNRSKGVVFSLR